MLEFRKLKDIYLDYKRKLFLVLLTTDDKDEFNKAYSLLTERNYKPWKDGMYGLVEETYKEQKPDTEENGP